MLQKGTNLVKFIHSLLKIKKMVEHHLLSFLCFHLNLLTHIYEVIHMFGYYLFSVCPKLLLDNGLASKIIDMREGSLQLL